MSSAASGGRSWRPLQAAGEDPFQQTRFDWDATSAQIKEHFDQMEGRAVKVAGA